MESNTENILDNSPEKKAKWPRGIGYIIGNEAAERYSFYGMKAILFVFLTQFIQTADGELDVLGKADAYFWIHAFVFVAYGISILGAMLSDIFLGKYKTIIYLSIVYIIGHFILALFETQVGFLVGCSLIALGSGGIKPCVSAHVGDQLKVTISTCWRRCTPISISLLMRAP